MKSLIVFDLDGTLTLSKSALDATTSDCLTRLLDVVPAVIMSGGAWEQFEKQVLDYLPRDARLQNLSLLPTCGTKFYQYKGKWTLLYSEDFSAAEKRQITDALTKAFDLSGFKPTRHWGDFIEDRGSQITLSALGQAAPLEEKKKWDPNFTKREKIKAILKPDLAAFSVQSGGATSIDVTRPGIDKGYGIKKLHETLHVAIADMLFIGDAVFPGGNDYPAKEAGVESIRVRDPCDTANVIEAIIACLRKTAPT